VANPKPSICIYDEEKEMFQLIDTSEMYKSWMFPARYVNDMMEDSRGNIWFGSHSGLGWLPGSTKKEYRILPVNHPELSGTAIFDLHEDSSGLVWVASYTGLYSIKVQASDSLTFSRFPFCQEAGNQEIIPRSVFQVSGGTIWIGTDQGLFQLNQDSSMIYRAKNENALLRHNMINAITEDKAGNLWMATDKGLVRYNPGFGRTFGVKLFERFDGLPYEGSISAPLYQSRSGKMMEGIDEEWIYSENRRYASYTGIPPGNYSFHVKASNNDGYWNDAGRSIRIHIQSPPWKTWWAYAGYAIIIIGLFILWRLYDLRRIRLRQQLEIEHIGAARLKELDRLKSRFFANISHEFRTPLMLVLGPLDKLIRKSRNDDDTRELTMMQRNAQRLQNLINELLDLSRLESGKMELHASQENMVSLVRSYVQQFESLAKHKGIALEFHSERDDIPAWVDRGKIEKILFNLLGNAFKFTGEGGRIELAVSSWQLAKVPGNIANCQLPTANLPEQCIIISISDTGSGIPPEKLPHIFDRFYQAGDDYTKDGEGTGIGLALTKELVELHGGTITVDSAVNRGSTFKVFLPIGVDELKSKSKEQKSKIILTSTLDNRQPTIKNLQPGTCNLQPFRHPQTPLSCLSSKTIPTCGCTSGASWGRNTGSRRRETGGRDWIWHWNRCLTWCFRM
jgi:signal transduction histidine kinase